ncbi:hypothetical protein D3C76_1473970 [compost metagenome]
MQQLNRVGMIQDGLGQRWQAGRVKREQSMLPGPHRFNSVELAVDVDIANQAVVIAYQRHPIEWARRRR